MWRKLIALALIASAAWQTAQAAPAHTSAPVIPALPTVVTSIKPVGWLVAEVAPKAMYQRTIMPAGYSPHEYQLRPQDAATIDAAAVLFWVGPAMEPWLVPQASKLPADKQLALLPELRHDDHAHDHEHDHADEHAEHDHASHQHASTQLANDPHLWLNPKLMQEAAAKVAATLTASFPEHQQEIQANLASFTKRLAALDAELEQAFKPYQQVGFAVYHDAYSHLVARYQLNQVAAVWRHESVPLGAKARAILLQQLADGDAVCLFYEPEHGADQVDKWLGKNQMRYSEIDLIGQGAPEGAGGYEVFMRALSKQMIDCLRQGNNAGSVN